MYVTFNSGVDEIKMIIPVGTSADYYCSFNNSATGLDARSNHSSGGPTQLMPAPASVGETNQVQAISIYNTFASGTIQVTIQYYNGTGYVLLEINLGVGYTLTYTADGSGWQVYDQNGDRQ